MKKLMSLLVLILAGSVMYTSAQSAAPPAYEKESNYDFEKTVEKIKEVAGEQGWSIPAEHDMQASMQKKGKKVLAAEIIVLCNADFAHRILKNDETREVLSILPCRIAVYKKTDGKTYLAWANLKKTATEFGEPAASVLNEVAKGMDKIIKKVTK